MPVMRRLFDGYATYAVALCGAPAAWHRNFNQVTWFCTLSERFVYGEQFMQSKQCVACGQAFRPRPQVPQQCYCPAPACQRERRRRRQKAKSETDPDFSDNQAQAQSAWQKRNPDYWREYRLKHPQYRERNRAQQGERNQERRKRLIAKMDVTTLVLPLASGIYQISQAPAPGIAKMDSWTVQITVVSMANGQAVEDCKERT